MGLVMTFNPATLNIEIRATGQDVNLIYLFYIGFSEEHNFSSFQEDAEKTPEATATMAEETLGPLDSIFPTEVVEESAKP